MTKFSPSENEILRRWQKNNKRLVKQELKDELQIRFDGGVLFDEPMARHTYIKIGGTAEVFLKPRTTDAVILALRLAHDHSIPCYFHGLGANTLVRDGGMRGFVLCLYDALKGYKVIAESDQHVDVWAEAGVSFSRLIQFSRDLPAAGLEPFAGIPGCVGGLVRMNAGIQGHEIQSVVRQITVLTKELQTEEISREHLHFEYRDLKIPRTHLIMSAVFRLSKGVTEEELETEIKARQKRRSDTQPLNFPNLGSIFKNPLSQKGLAQFTAGQLIDEAGLKGIRVGSARISEKHANFIINEGGASARDVLALIDLIKERVKSVTGIELETEIKIVGDEA